MVLTEDRAGRTEPGKTAARRPRLNRREFGAGLAFLALNPASLRNPTIQPFHRQAPPPTPSTWLGVSFGANELDSQTIPALALAQGAGVGWIRIVFDWSRIEASPGNFTWSGYDSLVRAARTLGFSILGQISFVTQWNTTAPPNLTPLWLREHYPPVDYNLWQQYVQMLVSRYRDSVGVWEVWNEPDHGVFWRSTPAEYARLLWTTSRTIRQFNPKAQVALGGLALGGNPNYLNPNFLPAILDDPTYPAAANFDVTSFHAYGPLAWIQSKISYLKSQLAVAGVTNRPIWLTECGYPSDPAQQTQAGYQNGVRSQAQWLSDTFSRVRQSGVEKLFWYELYDSRTGGVSSTSTSNSLWTVGLLDDTLTPKPSLNTFRTLGAALA